MASTISQRYLIGGLSFRLTLPDGPVARSLESSWKPFAAELNPSLEIAVQFNDQPPADSGAWALPTAERTETGALLVVGQNFRAEATADRQRVRWEGRAERFGIENTVKLLLADWLLEQGGLLLHSVAVSFSGQACLFIGPSGAGKSTLGGLCAKASWEVLGDELVAVRPMADAYRCDGTPWNIGAPSRATLGAVGDLRFALETKIEPIESSDLLRVILPNAMMPDPSPAGRAKLFRAASRLLGQVPAIRLHFALKTLPTPVLRAQLESTALP